jgi:diguanylate cyclase (GGDEF)-like protein
MVAKAASSPFFHPRLIAVARDCALVGAVVFLASLFGIMTRPLGFLAALWPANALLLGLFIRTPRLATPFSWLTAALAYLAADFATGGEVSRTFWLTAGNLAGVAAGCRLAAGLGEHDRRLRRPRSMLYLFAICVLSAMASSVVGGMATVLVFGRDFLTGAAFWFTTELVNSSILLPVVLTFPSHLEFSARSKDEKTSRNWLPFVLLVLSVGAAHFVGGAGAIAFPVPALLLCALTYSLAVTAIINLALCSWLLIGISGSLLPSPLAGDEWAAVMSVRLGIALMALGPLTVASINTAREELLRKLDRAASRDYLTDAVSRSFFMEKGGALVERLAKEGKPVAVLMLDLDRFKSINDRFGHAAGDHTLKSFAASTREVLRERDMFGRVGGEEFAVILPDTEAGEALAVAERIRIQVSKTPVDVGGGRVHRVTVSGGVACNGGRLDAMLADADGALYRAKHDGRNRIALALARLPQTRRASRRRAA